MHNLLSNRHSQTKKYKVEFESMDCSIAHKKYRDISIKGVRKGSLFVIDLDSVKKDEVYYFYSKASTNESWLWHKKLLHLNIQARNYLVKRELLRELPQLEFCQDGLCEDC